MGSSFEESWTGGRKWKWISYYTRVSEYKHRRCDGGNVGFSVGETKVEEEGKCEYGKVGFWDKIKLVGGGEVGVLNKNVGEMEVEVEVEEGVNVEHTWRWIFEVKLD